MPLTKEQFLELTKQGLSVEQIVDFERGVVPTQAPDFTKQEPTSFLGKARNFATSLIGGGKLAEGIGGALAAPEVRKTLSEESGQTAELQSKILARIKENKAAGKDTSQLEAAFKNSQGLASALSTGQTNFTDTLPTNKEVAGSALRLGGTMVGGYASAQAAKLFALTGAKTFIGGAARGLGAGVLAGGIEGAVQGAGLGLEQNQSGAELALSTGLGAAGGAAIGGAVGAIGGGIAGKLRGAADPEKVLNYATPSVTDLSPTKYQKALDRGLITPKTLTSPAKYNLPQNQQETVAKYSYLFEPDPVKTTQNIAEQVAAYDDEVGAFLRKNNGIYSKGELRNVLNTAIDSIDDIGVDEKRILAAKKDLVNSFVNSLETNDMETLWKARKDFDRIIESSFSGQYSLQKEVKKALRNGVQGFISDRTPDSTYSELMKEMSDLITMRDVVGLKAVKERSLSEFGKWVKDNPKLAQVMGWGSAAAVASGGLGFLFGKSEASSGG